MKKIISLLIIAILITLPWCGCTEAADVKISVDTVVKDDTVTVTIAYDGGGICGGYVDLMYTPEVAVYEEYIVGEAIDGRMHFVNEKYAENCIRINWSSVTPLPDSGNIVTYKFKLADPVMNKEDVELYSVKVSNEDGERMSSIEEYAFSTDKKVQKPSSSGGSSGAPSSPATGSVTITQQPQAKIPFADVKEDNWFYNAVLYAYENGLMNGMGDGNFAPDGEVTRGMVVTVLYRMAGSPESDAVVAFDDVDAQSWYFDAVSWANSNGIVTGVSETKFAPDSIISREQTATMLYRYAQYKQLDVSVSDVSNLLVYNDFDKISNYALKAIVWANAHGIIGGVSDTELNPDGVSTRAQIATILQRFLEM